jgi:hypothetical protein
LIKRRLGVEIELLAPRGKSRHDLARAIARHCGGSLKRIFYPQSEVSKVPGQPVFLNLVLGFEVRDHNGRWVATCVDDLTLQSDLVKSTPPRTGWYRILSDDARLLNLVSAQADPAQPLEHVLDPVARLFGTEPESGPNGMIRVVDKQGTPVAMAAPLPGERERPCELITAPMDSDHQVQLETLLSLARDLNFQIPAEGATHLHFDGQKLQEARVLANLVLILQKHGAALKERVGVNPQCRRLGVWPVELAEIVSEPSFRDLNWTQVKERLTRLALTKYCDFNIVNLLKPRPDKLTFEVRILPVSLQADPILKWAKLFENVLDMASDNDVLELPLADEPAFLESF